MTSLQFALRLNAASCIVFGTAFVLFAPEVSGFLGTMPDPLLFALGLVLLVNGGHLAWASVRERPIWGEVLWFSLGDMFWWLGSLALLATGFWISTPAGIFGAWAIAIAVGFLGLWQLVEFGRARTGLSKDAHFRRVGRSWLALPLWVKLWLFGLNGVFLFAFAFVPSDVARVVLTGYAASGPLLAGFALAQGGLTRLAGVGHIVPWVPMLVWLGLNFPAGETKSYVIVLFATVLICLLLDTVDTARWLSGERAVIGGLNQ